VNTFGRNLSALFKRGGATEKADYELREQCGRTATGLKKEGDRRKREGFRKQLNDQNKGRDNEDQNRCGNGKLADVKHRHGAFMPGSIRIVVKPMMKGRACNRRQGQQQGKQQTQSDATHHHVTTP